MSLEKITPQGVMKKGLRGIGLDVMIKILIFGTRVSMIVSQEKEMQYNAVFFVLLLEVLQFCLFRFKLLDFIFRLSQ